MSAMRTIHRSAMTALVLTACGAPEAAEAPHEPPAHVEHAVPESEITIVRFSADAMRRLALETAVVETSAVPAVRLVGGEVIVPPGRTTSVTAPVGGLLRATDVSIAPGTAVRRGDALLRLVPLAPVDRDVRARADREVAVATAQLEATEARLARMQQLIAERAGSQRTLEEATAARDVARADVEQAQARAQTTRDTPLLADIAMTVRAPEDGVVRVLSAVPGQAVAPGAPLLEIVAVDALQVRLPIQSGDLARIDPEATARVRPLGAEATSIDATPVAGPPTADPLAGAVDRYYALAPGAVLVPGERVIVELPLRSQVEARVLPYSALVYDAQGTAWVYGCAGENAFRRERIDPIRRSGDQLVFARGPALGACVLSTGASEVFGSEFEPGH